MGYLKGARRWARFVLAFGVLCGAAGGAAAQYGKDVLLSTVGVRSGENGGTGTVIYDDGKGTQYVLTAAHVIDPKESDYVTHPALVVQDAKLVAIDRDSDLALLTMNTGMRWAAVPVGKQRFEFPFKVTRGENYPKRDYNFGSVTGREVGPLRHGRGGHPW